MRAGWTISIALHGAIIGAGLYAIPYDDDRDRDVSRVTEVTLVIAPTPPAPRDQAPEVQDLEIAAIAAPSFNSDAGPAPDDDVAPTISGNDIIEDPSARDTEADLTALTEEVAQPEVAVAVAAPVEDASPLPEMGAPSLPGAGGSGFDSRSDAPRGPSLARPAAPRQAPRIAAFQAPAPPKPAERAQKPVESTTPSETAEETPAEPLEETVVEESTTAITPNEEAGAEEGSDRPMIASPRRRPENFEAQVAAALQAARHEEQERIAAAARAAEEEAAREQAEAEAEAQAAAQAEAEAEAEQERAAQAAADAAATARPDVPVGPPMSTQEKEGLRLAVQACWNVPAGLEGASDLRVVVGVELDPNGRIVGQPRLIEPASIDRREVQIAFEAARRALLRCQAGGYDLPREKYEHWRNLEVGFDPKGMLARW